MPETSGALRSGQALVAALLAAVRLASITPGADEEEVVAEPAAGEPEAVVHASPGEHAENLSSLVGACETGRTSVCRRSPESPGRNPGLSSFRRAAWARSLPPPHAPVNFLAARAAPGRHDVRVINLRIREAINMGACAVRVLKRSGATHAEDAARLSHVHGEAACAVWDSLETWSGPCSEQAPRRVDRPDAIGESPEVADTHGSWGKSCSRTCARTLRHRGSCHAGDHSRCPGTQT